MLRLTPRQAVAMVMSLIDEEQTRFEVILRAIGPALGLKLPDSLFGRDGAAASEDGAAPLDINALDGLTPAGSLEEARARARQGQAHGKIGI